MDEGPGNCTWINRLLHEPGVASSECIVHYGSFGPMRRCLGSDAIYPMALFAAKPGGSLPHLVDRHAPCFFGTERLRVSAAGVRARRGGKMMTSTSTAFALSGLGGNNAHSAGFLAAAQELQRQRFQAVHPERSGDGLVGAVDANVEPAQRRLDVGVDGSDKSVTTTFWMHGLETLPLEFLSRSEKPGAVGVVATQTAERECGRC